MNGELPTYLQWVGDNANTLDHDAMAAADWLTGFCDGKLALTDEDETDRRHWLALKQVAWFYRNFQE